MSKVLSVWQSTGLSISVNLFKIMESFTLFIGINISKATLDWAVVVAKTVCPDPLEMSQWKVG